MKVLRQRTGAVMARSSSLLATLTQQLGGPRFDRQPAVRQHSISKRAISNVRGKRTARRSKRWISSREQRRAPDQRLGRRRNQQKIRDLIPPAGVDATTRLVVNAIHFLGDWASPFEVRTGPGILRHSQRRKLVPTMQQAGSSASSGDGVNVSARLRGRRSGHARRIADRKHGLGRVGELSAESSPAGSERSAADRPLALPKSS
jgi:hypothetical protein